MQELFEYIKKPVYITVNKEFSAVIFFKLLLVFYLLLIPTSGLIVIMQILDVLPHNIIDELDGSIQSLCLIIFLAPLLEELTFRLPLRINKLTLSACLSIIFIIFIKAYGFPDDYYIVYLLSVPIFFIIYCILFFFNKIYKNIKACWIFNSSGIFYFSAIFFGLSHLINYTDIYWWMLIISPLITLPFIVMGLFLGYIRMNYGFIYSLLFHSCINLLSSVSLIIRLIN